MKVLAKLSTEGTRLGVTKAKAICNCPAANRLGGGALNRFLSDQEQGKDVVLILPSNTEPGSPSPGG